MSTLYAARLEMGRALDIDASQSGRYLIEVSNAGKSSAGTFKNMFKYAVGINWRLKKGAWLEMRLGRNRSVARWAFTRCPSLSGVEVFGQ